VKGRPLAGVALAAAVSFTPPVLAQQHLSGPILVIPFDGGANPRAAWLGEGAAMLLTDDLNAMGASALTREERVHAFERLQLPPRALLTSGTVIKVGQLVGAATVVSGHLAFAGDTLTVSVEAIRIDTGRISAMFDERGPLSDVLVTLERSARRLVPQATVPTAEVEKQHPPLAAYENYVKGLLAQTPAIATRFLQKAIALAPRFDQARLALAGVQSEVGNWDAARTTALAVPDSSPERRNAQFSAALSEISLKKYDDAFMRLQTLSAAQPAVEIFTNLGIVQLRRGATTQTGRATYFLNKAVELDPMSVNAAFNLGYAYWQEQDQPAALYWLREAVRRDPADADAHFGLASVLEASGSATEAQRERELARRLSAEYEEGGDRPNGATVPKGLERLSLYLQRPEAGRADSALVATERREQSEMATFHLDRGRRFFEREEDRGALAELQRAIYLSPYQAEAHLLVGRIHLRAGRTHEAIEALKISLWSQETAEGHIALGEAYLQGKDPTAARAEAERALVLKPGLAAASQLLDRTRPASSHP
jgi:Tfp pilus assembly protein PilF